MSPRDLAGLSPFRHVGPQPLREVAQMLEPVHFEPGETIYSDGDRGETFVIILAGEVVVSRGTPHGHRHEIARGGPGSIFGELAMLTGARRRASLSAATAVEAALGTAEAFGRLLDADGLRVELMELASQRLAELAEPRTFGLADGTDVAIRPLLAGDRPDFASALERQSPDWRRSRFFTPTNPSRSLVDYLVHIDYMHHFAWVILRPDVRQGVGVGRYVTLGADSTVADLAFEVDDHWRGRGVATRLLGALGAAAQQAGITEFQADVLGENRAMRAVFDKAGARWASREPGVVRTRFPVDAAAALLDEAERVALGAVAHDIVTGAGLALRREGPAPTDGSSGASAAHCGDDDEDDAGDQQDRAESDPAEQPNGQI